VMPFKIRISARRCRNGWMSQRLWPLGRMSENCPKCSNVGEAIR
jgi:hypothetical protein